MGYLRRMTGPQGDRFIEAKQEGFLGGLNLDVPSSEIDATEMADVKNVIMYRSHLESRPGVKRYHTISSPSGTYNTSVYYPTTSRIINQSSTKITYSLLSSSGIYFTTDCTGEYTSVGVNNNRSGFSFKDNVVLIGTSGTIWSVYGDFVYKLNSANPTQNLQMSHSDTAGEYKYRYVYTYAYLNGGVKRLESGVVQNSSTKAINYREHSCNVPIESSTITGITGFTAPSGTGTAHWTHIYVYRTLDIGENGLQAGNDPEQYYLCATYTMAQATAGGLFGIGSMAIGSTFIVGPGSINLKTSDEDLVARSVLCNTLYYEPLPAAAFGAESNGFLAFVTNTSTKNTIYYSPTGITTRAGYYHPAYQYVTVNDSIEAIQPQATGFLIMCKNSTYLLSTSSYFESGNPNTGTTIPTLDAPVLVDGKVGCEFRTSVCQIDENSLIAVCSDKSVRYWDGVKWSSSLSRFKVDKELQKIGSCMGGYDPRGIYFLFYSYSTSGTTTKCLRFGFSEDIGKGWSYYSGTGFPVVNMSGPGLIQIHTATVNEPVLLAFDEFSGSGSPVFTWLETYDGSSGNLARREDDYQDQAYDIDTYFIPRDYKGSSERFFISHRQTNLYFRPYARLGSFQSGFQVDLTAYTDDNSSSTDINYNVDIDGDIHFWKKISGHRVRLKISTNKGGYSLTGLESIFSVQDRPVISRTAQVDRLYQADIAASPVFWLGRNRIPYNIVDLSAPDVSVGTVATTTGKDSNANSAILLDGTSGSKQGYLYDLTGLSSSDNFTISFWLAISTQTEAVNHKVFGLYRAAPSATAVSNSYSTFDNGEFMLYLDTSLDLIVEHNYNASQYTISGPFSDGSWNHFVFTYNSATPRISYYKNNVALGSTDIDLDGIKDFNLVLGTQIKNCRIFDFRVTDTIWSTDDINYYYLDTTNNSGNKVIPYY